MKRTAHQQLKYVGAINPDAHAAGAVNSKAIDVRGWEEALINLDLGVLGASATVDCKIQESDTIDVSNDLTNAVDVTGAAFTQKTKAADDEKKFSERLDLRGRKRYIRIVLTVAVATSDAAANVVLAGYKHGSPTALAPSVDAAEATNEFSV